jgi:adenosylcobinamide-phosphate synthase
VAPELLAATQPALSVLALALLCDLLLGEPPNALHPVVLMGHSIALLTRIAPERGARVQLLAGAAIAVCVPVLFALATVLLLASLARWPLLGLALNALLLKSSFALRALRRAAERVRTELLRSDVAAARQSLRSLCSRSPEQLDSPLLVAGAVESLAENASDSFVAPLFYYACFGLPGAVFYRAVNTLDSMIGYHGRFEYLGKAAARLDDLLNFIPARLTALLLLAAGFLCRCDVARGLRILRRDGAATESPNAGRPMAAMAGLLGVVLEKPGHYRLGEPAALLQPATIKTASRVVALCACLAAAFMALAIGARHVGGS